MLPKTHYESNTSIEGVQTNCMHQSTANTSMIEMNISNKGNYLKEALRPSHPNRYCT